MDREHHDRHPFRQLAQQLKSGEIRHRDIADTDLDTAPGQTCQRLTTGAELRHHLKIRLKVQQLGKSGADDEVVVDKGDGGHGAFWRVKKRAYLNDKRVGVQALRYLLEEHRNFVKHGGIGLVAHHFLDIFQLVDLRNHLLQTLIVIHQ